MSMWREDMLEMIHRLRSCTPLTTEGTQLFVLGVCWPQQPISVYPSGKSMQVAYYPISIRFLTYLPYLDFYS
jgi:hypothetical protein